MTRNNGRVFRVVIATLALGAMQQTVVTAAPAQGPCPAGTTWVRPSSGSTLPDGGTMNQYNIHGETHEVPVPPVGFSPMTASDASLESYGMPPRPTDAAGLSAWKADMANWRRTPDRGLCETPYRSDASKAATTASDDTQAAQLSLNWAGYVIDTTSNAYIAVQGDFTQPTVKDTVCTTETEASWTGLGGFNTARLIQTGTAYLRGSTTPVAWYEYLGANGAGINLTTMPSVTVHKGDRIHTYVVIQTSTGKTTFYVADNTTGTSQSVIKTLSVGTYYDGSSTDFIDERLSVGGTIQTLYDFTNVAWTNTKVQNTAGTWSTLGSHTEVAVDMVNVVDHDILAAPAAMSSTTTFLDDYKQCG